MHSGERGEAGEKEIDGGGECGEGKSKYDFVSYISQN